MNRTSFSKIIFLLKSQSLLKHIFSKKFFCRASVNFLWASQIGQFFGSFFILRMSISNQKILKVKFFAYIQRAFKRGTDHFPILNTDRNTKPLYAQSNMLMLTKKSKISKIKIFSLQWSGFPTKKEFWKKTYYSRSSIQFKNRECEFYTYNISVYDDFQKIWVFRKVCVFLFQHFSKFISASN